VDDFIRNSQINSGLMVNIIEFVLYYQFKDIEYIAKFESYEATWIEGNIQSWKNINFKRNGPMRVVLKKLNNSENITSKELNEVHVHINLILIYLNHKKHLFIFLKISAYLKNKNGTWYFWFK